MATLRGEAGRTPYDRGLTDLVGELSTRSDEFRTRWARHNVRLHRTAPERLRHPMLGDIELTGNALELPGDGLTVITYTVEPGSESEQALAFLASWSTERRQATARADDVRPRTTPPPDGGLLPARPLHEEGDHQKHGQGREHQGVEHARSDLRRSSRWSTLGAEPPGRPTRYG